MTIQEFDLPARWRTLLLDNYSEAIHNLEVTWPDVQSLEVSYRDIESFDPDFALSICLLYTSPSPRDVEESRMPSSA